jgi:hypothetical protein
MEEELGQVGIIFNKRLDFSLFITHLKEHIFEFLYKNDKEEIENALPEILDNNGFFIYEKKAYSDRWFGVALVQDEIKEKEIIFKIEFNKSLQICRMVIEMSFIFSDIINTDINMLVEDEIITTRIFDSIPISNRVVRFNLKTNEKTTDFRSRNSKNRLKMGNKVMN